MHRHTAGFNFRYSNRVKLGVDDKARKLTALRGIVGKRLTNRSQTVCKMIGSNNLRCLRKLSLGASVQNTQTDANGTKPKSARHR